MIVGVPKETAEGERRVALVPELVAKLTKAGKDKLEALGRVARTHPTFAVLVVAHAAPGAPSLDRDKLRAEIAKQTMAAAGAPPDRIGIQTPGTQLPGYDPSDTKSKSKNERIEIVFVGGGR